MFVLTSCISVSARKTFQGFQGMRIGNCFRYNFQLELQSHAPLHQSNDEGEEKAQPDESTEGDDGATSGMGIGIVVGIILIVILVLGSIAGVIW